MKFTKLEKILMYFPVYSILMSIHMYFIRIFEFDNIIYKTIAQTLTFLRSISPYIYIVFLGLFVYYIFKEGLKKNKIVIVLVLFLMIMSYSNSLLIKNFYTKYNYELNNLSLISSFLIYFNYLFILLKKYNYKILEEKLLKIVKIITLFISFIYTLSFISGVYYFSYTEIGYSAWFQMTNSIGHILVMTLPLLIYSYHKEKNYKTILLIIINIILCLLIGTKAAYFSIYTSLIIFILLYIYSLIKRLKIDKNKLIPITIILIFLLVFNNHFIATNMIQTLTERIDINEDSIIGRIIYTLINGRNIVTAQTWEYFINSPLNVKLFGMGIYYPLFDHMQVELDFFDTLFKHGIVGLLGYLTFITYYFKYILTNYFKGIKKEYIASITLLGLSLALGTVASLVAGHVLYFHTSTLIYTIALFLPFAYLTNKYRDKKIFKDTLPKIIEKNIELSKLIAVILGLIIIVTFSVMPQIKFKIEEQKMIDLVELAKSYSIKGKEYFENQNIELSNNILIIPLSNIEENDSLNMENSFILVLKGNETYYYAPQLIPIKKDNYALPLDVPYTALNHKANVKKTYILQNINKELVVNNNKYIYQKKVNNNIYMIRQED